VLSTGYYQFIFAASPTGVSPTIQLKYLPTATPASPSEVGGEAAVHPGGDVVEQKWKSEQIGDFVRKLGFLDAEGSDGDQINRFLYLNQVCVCVCLHVCVCVCVSVSLREREREREREGGGGSMHMPMCAF